MLSNNELMDLHKSNEEILERISNGLECLKEQSTEIHEEICKQSDQLDLIGGHVECANETIKTANKDIEVIGSKSGKLTAAIGIGHVAAVIGSAIVAPIVGPVLVSVPFVSYYIYKLTR